MKLCVLATFVTFARSQSFTLTGDENPDELMDIINQIQGGQVDEIEEAIQNFMGVDRVTNIQQLRTFRRLKIAVLFLQNQPKFGRYSHYGCYCLPDGDVNIAKAGYGKPMDDLDKACQDFKNCYRCLVDEHDKDCDGQNLGYGLELIEVAGSGERRLECTNNAGSCRHNICQCDKALAEKLSALESDWDESLHHVKGGFDRDQCTRASGGGNFVECCGDTNTFPFNQPRKSNQCCEGFTAKPEGSCLV